MSILPIFIPHAGCPHQCVFCNQKTISGQKLAAVAGAKEQLVRWRSWLRPSAANEAAFYGGSFTGLPLELQEELLTLTDALLAEGFIGSVRLSTRPDYIDEERLQLLQQHGVRLVELGVQSLDDRVLAAAERGHTAAQVAPILGSDPQTIRMQARLRPDLLPFPAVCLGSRVKIPKEAFLRVMRGL